MRSPVKDREALILNVDSRFEKLAGYTTEGKQVKFYGHASKNTSPNGASKSNRKLRLPRKQVSNQGSPATSTEFFLKKHKEEQTKSMLKYEKDLEFKNRVLREREKRVFN